MGMWQYRLVQDDKGKLSFAAVRFRPEEETISGLCNPFGPPFNNGTLEDMRELARSFVKACNQGIIGPDGKDPDYETRKAAERRRTIMNDGYWNET